ncbi:DUF4932 domain-containing protein [Bacteroidales bacterium OttesenSCG-928-B11]|nr:DUF4932 domain-containing protein [Bacteroidales bacterium OttesenSCG-928-E04]MDL2307970.1 DUF4932 domain-containing protein [Bacteroidales bacterium OttesenSCG-928-C03]MDL2311669.1 DUF4932 domain-containing protein [Bacteroidales bacterium OttesenSCG-928-B11]MDL2325760.1 DUF4932 domain-containing protein [Bacteroidales bacterium OttesenSCG-928-A14]
MKAQRITGRNQGQLSIVIRQFLTFVLLLLVTTVGAQQISIKPVVDERMELMSIIFRIAGAEEYVADDLEQYADAIDRHFIAYKNHPVIEFVLAERESRWIGYDAVMSMATILEINEGKISIQKDLEAKSLDDRWDYAKNDEFIGLLNDFYQKSNFRRFFDEQLPVRQAAEANFTKLLKDINFDWYEKFYGVKPTGDFYLVLSLANGPNNYGGTIYHTDGREDIFSILGAWATDSTGMPTYSPRVISTVIHEFNHAFCNPLIYEKEEQLLPKGEEFFKLVQELMAMQAYGNAKTMLCEILVRACEIKYTEQQGANSRYIDYALKNQEALGFLWIKELYTALGVYEKNRGKYPTLRDFMPEIIALQNSLNSKKIAKQLDAEKPVMTVENIKNGSKKVDPATEYIIVAFSKPMSTGNNGCSYGEKGEEYFIEVPEDKNAYWSEDGLRWYLPVKLEAGKTYSLSFPARFFMSAGFARPKNTVYLDFTTKK